MNDITAVTHLELVTPVIPINSARLTNRLQKPREMFKALDQQLDAPIKSTNVQLYNTNLWSNYRHIPQKTFRYNESYVLVLGFNLKVEGLAVDCIALLIDWYRSGCSSR